MMSRKMATTTGTNDMRIDYASSVSDVLTSVMNNLQFKGQVFCYSKFSAPWAIRMKRKDYAHFHVFEHGQGWIELEASGEQTFAATGDLIILPHGAAHILKDKPSTKPVDIDFLLDSCQDHVLQHGGGGAETTTVCGAFKFENQVGNPILSLLPELIHVPCVKMEGRVWLESALNFLAQEAQYPREGSGSIIGHLTGIIFVQAVRAWIESQPLGHGGWLGALRDKQISEALSLIHQKPAEPWTISKLASEVGMSRSAFATKFTSLVGDAPLTYLTQWRMNLAASYLLNDQLRIREIAERVGYQSQASFTNAFKRSFAVSPREYKAKNKQDVAPTGKATSVSAPYST
jgi:AraC-like DNA-binding protein